ncbi:MAG: MFS transporter [Chloroflexota bacterium]
MLTEGNSRDKSRRFFYGYIVAASSFLIMALYGGLIYAIGVFFLPVAEEFGSSRATLSIALSLSSFVMGIYQLLAGEVNDRWGPRLVLSACGVLLFAGYFLMSRIGAVWHIIVIQMLLTTAGMSGLVPMRSTIVRWFVKRRGMMSGIVTSGIGLGGMIMPPLAAWLITSYGWRTSYAVIGIASLVMVIGFAQFLRGDPAQMGLLPDGAPAEPKADIPRPKPAVADFSLKRAVRTNQFWLITIMWFAVNVGYRAVMVHIVPNAIDLNITPAVAASILTVIGAATMTGRVAMGSLSDKIGTKAAFIISNALMTVALFLLVGARELWLLYIVAAVFGFANGGGVSLLAPLVAALYGLKSHGLILASIYYGMYIGNFVGPVMAGRLFDVTGNYRLAFLITAILSLTSLILMALVKMPGRQKAADSQETVPTVTR